MSTAKARQRLKLAYTREDGASGILVGRYAWTLQHLISAGSKGVTPIERPAPRWSHYVFWLRKEQGFNIETIEERHGGPFPGNHGRYVLRDAVKVRSIDSQEMKTPAPGKCRGQNPNTKLAGVGGSDEG